MDWTREQRELDQDQDQEGDRAQRRDTFVTGDRDREGESGSPSFTSSNSLVNTTNRSPASNGDDDVQQGSLETFADVFTASHCASFDTLQIVVVLDTGSYTRQWWF